MCLISPGGISLWRLNRLFRSVTLTRLLLLTLLPGVMALVFTGYQTYGIERSAADQDLMSRVSE